MTDPNSPLSTTMAHDIEVGKDASGEPLFRDWGYSELVPMGSGAPTSSCDFCKNDFGIDDLYRTVCWCGIYAESSLTLKHSVNGSYNPEHRSVTFWCCKECMPKITSLIQMQRKELLNHEVLDRVLAIMKFIYK